MQQLLLVVVVVWLHWLALTSLGGQHVEVVLWLLQGQLGRMQVGFSQQQQLVQSPRCCLEGVLSSSLCPLSSSSSSIMAAATATSTTSSSRSQEARGTRRAMAAAGHLTFL